MKRKFHQNRSAGEKPAYEKRPRRWHGALLGLLLASNMFISTGCILTDLLGAGGGSGLGSLLGGLTGGAGAGAAGAANPSSRRLGSSGAAATPGAVSGRAAAPTASTTGTRARPAGA